MRPQRGGKAESLVRRTGSAGSDWELLPLAGGGAGLAQCRRGALAEILDAGDRVVLLAPAEDVPMALLELPRLRRSERPQAALFELESRLAQPSDRLVLSLLPASGTAMCAFWCERARLAAWIAAVQRSGAELVTVLPEWCLLPNAIAAVGEGTLRVWCAEHRLWMRAPDGTAACVDSSLGPAVLANAMECYMPRRVELYGELDDEALAQAPTVERNSLAPLEQRYAAPRTLRGLDLRRDAMSAANPPPRWRQLRGVAAAALIAIVLAGAVSMVKLERLSEMRDYWDARAVSAYRAAFPDETRVVDVRRQLTQKLNLDTAEGDARTSPVELLGALAPVMGAKDGARLVSVSYDGSSLEAVVRSGSLGEFESLRDALRAANPGLDVSMHSLVSTQDGARAVLQLSSRS